jgi:hypothetical protein
MSDLSKILAGMLEMLSPPHEAEAAAVKGGPAAGKLILRLYEMALEAEPIAHELDAELAVLQELGPTETEVDEFVAELKVEERAR